MQLWWVEEASFKNMPTPNFWTIVDQNEIPLFSRYSHRVIAIVSIVDSNQTVSHQLRQRTGPNHLIEPVEEPGQTHVAWYPVLLFHQQVHLLSLLHLQREKHHKTFNMGANICIEHFKIRAHSWIKRWALVLEMRNKLLFLTDTQTTLILMMLKVL